MNLKKDLNTIMLSFCVLSIILGVLCIVFAGTLATAIPYIIGALVLIEGIYTLVTYFVRKDINSQNNFGLAQGLINIVLGILILLASELFTTAIGIIIAICLLVYGLFQLNLCINLKKDSKSFIFELVESLILIVFAIILLIFSNSAIKIVITIIGVALLVMGLYAGIKSFVLNKQIDKMQKEAEEEFVETTATEVKKDTDNKE